MALLGALLWQVCQYDECLKMPLAFFVMKVILVHSDVNKLACAGLEST